MAAVCASKLHSTSPEALSAIEYRINEPVEASTSEDTQLEPLFRNFTIPAEVTSDELETIDHMTITVRGHAIQSLGFEDADAAWAAFDQETSAEEGE